MTKKLHQAVIAVLLMPLAGVGGPIHDAVKAGDIPTLTKILAEGPRGIADETDKGASTPLHWASTWNQPEAALLLIRAGANMESRTDNGATPLHWAAYRNSTGVADLLIRFGADITSKSSKGYSPLHWAAIGDGSDVAKLLIAQKVDVNAIASEGGVTPLHCAIRKQSRAILPILLENGADLYRESSDGSRPISWITNAEYRAYFEDVVARVSQRTTPTTGNASETTPTTSESAPEVKPSEKVPPTVVTPMPTPDSANRMVLPDGSLYAGEIRDGRMHGKGTLTLADGSRFSGMWVEGIKEGYGVYEYIHGDKYEGNWVKGERSGRGKYSYRNGGVLEGTWQANQLAEGSGTYIFPDGDKYAGQWISGMMWGLGTYTTSDGQVFNGYWNANEFIAPLLSDAPSGP